MTNTHEKTDNYIFFKNQTQLQLKISLKYFNYINYQIKIQYHSIKFNIANRALKQHFHQIIFLVIIIL